MDKIKINSSAEPLWKEAVRMLGLRYDKATIMRWFNPIKPASLKEDRLSLVVPNDYFKGLLIERFYETIRSTVNDLAGRELVIEFIVDEEGPAVQRPREEHAQRPAAAAPEHGKEPVKIGEKLTFDAFVVGPSNRFAHAAALAVSESPAKAYNPLFIYGGVGLGKTHLMHAIAHNAKKASPRLKTFYTSSEQFTNQLIGAIQNRGMLKFRERYRNMDLLLIDDIQFIAGKEATQEEFFHTFNALYDAHKQIVISSDRPPKEISTLEERLVSRFEWGLVTDIQPPDLETRIAILRKKREGHGEKVPEDVIMFIAEKIRANIRELEGALIRVIAYASLMNTLISVETAQEVLKDMVVEGEKRVTVDLIQRRVAEHFDIGVSDMKTKKRSRQVVYPRQVAMYLTRHMTDLSLPEIGELFGGRDHTTVIHANNKIDKEIKGAGETKRLVDKLILKINS